jgi:predicted glycogen debranching enzyme
MPEAHEADVNIHLPTLLCRDLETALQREWLVTNGLGGFAAGTVAGALTRRYHGLLLAALKPPVGRRLLVTKLDDTVVCDTERYALYTNVWQSGIEQPAGCRFLERFDLNANVPTWTYALPAGRLTKQIWMEAGRNVTFVRYALAPGAAPVVLQCRLLVTDRDYHHLLPGAHRTFQVQATGARIDVRADPDGTPTCVRCAGATAAQAEWQVDYTWCHGFHLRVEAARGYDHLDSHLVVGLCCVPLQPGDEVTFVAATVEHSEVDVDDALARHRGRMRGLLDTWAQRTTRPPKQAPLPVRQLVLAADQFLVARPAPEEPDGHTVIAGYPWFTDWGRDTMISLPGLTLVTGRFELARRILRTWARYVDHGLIPNRFPDVGDRPEYNTADATLWYLWAIDQYVRATADVKTLAELFPVMEEVVAWHRRGTWHNIRVDRDGLVAAGEPGLNLTWMDAKYGDQVFTPRLGKPIELSALWYDALCNLARLADLLEKSDAEYMRLAGATRKSFARFWNRRRNCCFDVLDGPDGNDPRIRPNQIFAVSLTHSPLPRERQLAVVKVCQEKLLTWFGLRTLAPEEPGYRGRYVGNLFERDSAYHQGTSWGWLLGPFVLAHYRVHRDRERAREFLAPLLGQLWSHAVGSLSEIFDGDEPHTPRGCVAQAWSVAEALRAWWMTQR